MSDYNSSLPVRTENAGDVAVKIVDKLIPSQQLAVNADGSVNITDNNASLTIDAVALDIRHLTYANDKVDASGSTVTLDSASLAALESITVQNGAGASAVNIQDGGNSITVDGTVALDAASLAALESITVQNGSGASAVNIQDGGNSITVDATLLDIRHLSQASDNIKISNGANSLAINTDGSINVVPQEDPGVETVDFNTAASVASNSSSNHDITVATGGKLYQVLGSASGKMKIEVQVETANASGVFKTVGVQFNSTANPNMNLALQKYQSIPVGARVRVIRTNKDLQSQDLYTTIILIAN